MKTILVIQLARMGDILQSTPLLAGLREHHPQAHICVLVDDQLREVVENNPCVDEVIGFRIRAFLPFILSPHHTLIEKYRLLKAELQSLESRVFDIVFNLNYTPLGIVLSSLLDAREVRGYRPAPNRGREIIKDRWMNYLFILTSHRRLNRFNLVDIFTHCADAVPSRKRLVFKVRDEDRGFARRFCEEHRISDSELVLGLQVGAGSRFRRWPADYIADLARLLIQKLNARVILFGSRSEAEVGREIELKSKGPEPEAEKLINAIGSTSIGQLAALLERCNLLVTPDTGTMHLATAVGTRVTALFYASAFCYETGPYGEGNIILQANLPCFPCIETVTSCRDFRCKDVITPGLVFEVVKQQVNDCVFQAENIPPDVDVFYSQADGWGVRYLPMVRSGRSVEEIIALWYEGMWRRFFDGDRIDRDSNAHSMLAPHHPRSSQQDVKERLRRFFTDLGLVAGLMKRGRDLSGRYIASEGESLDFEIKDVEELLRHLRQTEPLLGPIVDYYFIERENLYLNGNEFKRELRDLFDGLYKSLRLAQEEFAYDPI